MAKSATEPQLPPLHRPSPLPKSRPKQPPAAGVLATHLAKHLDLSRQRIQQLVDEAVLSRLPNGSFDLDDCRVKYIRWLRDPSGRVAKSEVNADFTAAKAELIKITVLEKRRELIPLEYARAVEDQAIAVVLQALGGMAARVGGSDLALRRRIDEVVREVRTELAAVLNQLADANGEPALDAPATDNAEG